jgi:hypothetical protein
MPPIPSLSIVSAAVGLGHGDDGPPSPPLSGGSAAVGFGHDDDDGPSASSPTTDTNPLSVVSAATAA